MSSALSIAIVGSGIAGLAAAWRLGAEHRVVIYEKQPNLGMAAHGLEIGGARVDIPLRVIYRSYYPSLVSLYEEAGIEITPVSYSGSFSDLKGKTYFRYRNRRYSGKTFPMLEGGNPFGKQARQISMDMLRLMITSRRDLLKLSDQSMSLDDYAYRKKFSSAFYEAFLLPTFAGIATCDIQTVREYPASVIVEYLSRGLLFEGVCRTQQGADFVVKRLGSRCAEQRLGSEIVAITQVRDGWEIRDSQGHSDQFDHVILATQGNQALKITTDIDAEATAVLSRFGYQASEVLVHTDKCLMPRHRRNWSPVNFAVDSEQVRPEATIWLNSVLPIHEESEATFQSWNALRSVHPDKVLAKAVFERPVVNAETQSAISALQELHAQPNRRLWYCGSYAEQGVPLLESATRSAFEVCSRILAD